MPESFSTVSYVTRIPSLPTSGYNVVASHSDSEVVVFQVCSAQVARHYLATGSLESAPGLLPSRRLWLRPSFILSCYRCGWTTWPNKEYLLAITLEKSFFDRLLREGAPSQKRLTHPVPKGKHDVLLQWTPERAPDGGCEPWESVQIGLRGEAAQMYATGEGVLRVEDVSEFVRENRKRGAQSGWAAIQVPCETLYDVGDSLNVIPTGTADGGETAVVDREEDDVDWFFE